MAITDGLLGGLFGGVSNLLSSGINMAFSGRRQYQAYEYAKKLQQQQYDLQQKGYLEGPTNARQGMVNAGYNPILALSNGSNFAGSVAGGSPVSAPNAEIGDFASSASNAYRAFKLEKQQANNQSLIAMTSANSNNAQADLNREQALTEQAKRTQMDFQNAMYDVEKHLKQKELSWADRKFYSEIYDNMQRAENYGAMASIARYNAQINAQNAQTNAMNANTARGSAISEHNARQVGLNLQKEGLRQGAVSTAGGAIRDFGVGVGGLMTGRGFLQKSPGRYSHSAHNSKVVKSLHTFGRTRSH